MKVLNQERLLNGEAVEVKLRNTDFRRIEKLRIGDIISLPIHTQSHVRRVHLDDNNHTYAGDFGAIQSKFRKIILTADTCSGKSGVPIFTYGDRGLEGKTEEEVSEHRHIRDITDESPEAQSLEGRVLRAIRDPEWPDYSTFIRAPSVVNLTTIITLLPGDKCSLEGRLEQGDLVHLLMAVQYHQMKSSIKAIQMATGMSMPKVEDGVDRAEADAS
jgi:hypothetical protein